MRRVSNIYILKVERVFAARRRFARAGAGLLPAWMTISVFACAGAPAAYAANFACAWNDGTANWTTTADWSGCNSTFPNNVGGNTYDATVSSGDPTLTTAVTIGSVTINGPGQWDLAGTSASATLTGTLTNSGNVALDFFGSQGGSNLTVGGTLTNTSSGTVQVGTSGGSLSATSTVSAAALSNSGTIDLFGNTTPGTTNQATMLIAGAAPSSLTGTYNLSGDALLQFGSGAITSIASSAPLNETGAQARVAIAGTPNSNSALTTLSSNAGQLMLNNGATVTTNPGTNLSNSNFVALDFFGNQGGSNLTVGGTLTNTGSGTVQVGTSGGSLSATSTVSAAALSNTGTIDLFGNTTPGTTNQATMLIAGAAPSSLTGTYNLSGDALLQYRSGAITSIASGAQLNETGAQARVAIAGTPNSNSALTTLSSNAGQLMLNNGATVTTNPGTNLSNSNFVALDFFGNQGGSNLTVGGTLTNTGSGTVQVGTSGGSLSATSTVSAAALSNTGTIDLFGNTTPGTTNQATMLIAGAAPSSLTGTYNLSGDALLQFGSGAITGIASGAQLNETGAQARVAIAGTPNTNSALTTLSSNAGQLMLNNGATVTTNPGTNLANSNFVALDFFGSQGGSGLTVGGTLTNTSSGTVQVGTSGGSLSATSTVSAAALSNSGTIDLFGNTTPGTTNQATMLIAGAAPSSL